MTGGPWPSNGDPTQELPQPTVEFARSGNSPDELTPAQIKGMVMNPVCAGLGPFPPLVSDGQWIGACRRVLEEDSPEQFLVNLLFVLRQTLGTHEDGPDDDET